MQSNLQFDTSEHRADAGAAVMTILSILVIINVAYMGVLIYEDHQQKKHDWNVLLLAMFKAYVKDQEERHGEIKGAEWTNQNRGIRYFRRRNRAIVQRKQQQQEES